MYSPFVTLITIFALALSLSAADRFPNDFSPYPSAAQPCLNAADRNSGCNGSTVPTMNKCLCSDTGDFITSTAKCIGRESPGDLAATYITLKTNCDGSNTPMAITEAEFLQLGENTTSTTQIQTPEETHHPNEDEEEDKESRVKKGGRKGGANEPQAGMGLATGAKIGIAIGATAVILLIGGAVVARRRSGGENPPAQVVTAVEEKKAIPAREEGGILGREGRIPSQGPKVWELE